MDFNGCVFFSTGAAATRSFVKRILSEPCVSNAPHVKSTRDETEEAST